MSVLKSTNEFLESVELDEVGKAKADICRVLATKLDQASEATTAGVAQSVAGIARELNDTLTTLAEAKARETNPVRNLFAVDA